MMNDKKPIPITHGMLPGFRERAVFPKFTLAEASFDRDADVFVAHLHMPIFVGRIGIMGQETIVRAIPIDQVPPHDPALVQAGQFFIREASGPARISCVLDPKENPLPPWLILYERSSDWTGVMRTTPPRFISEIRGKSILPLDPCDDILPWLDEAKQFYWEWVGE